MIKADFLKNFMTHKIITTDKKFMEITVSGPVDKTGLYHVISNLMTHPDYNKKNTFWDFSDAVFDLTIDDLSEIAGILSMYKPRGELLSKKISILLIPRAFSKAAGYMFVSMTELFPVKFKIVGTREEAYTFLV